MTDGILLNEIQDDPMLRAYDAIIIDEAHERSLNIDFILGCLRQLSEQRKDLKIVITSATIDTESFSKAFDGAPIIEVSGRMFPVDTHYRPFDENEGDLTFIEAASETINEILYDNRQGDILVFLPGERDIHELRRELEDSPARTCDILSLYGRMANADQQRIFHPQGRRRIILSTNIAETSLTVPGIRYVVDTGLARISRYSATSRTQRLPIEPIAQSSADQRKGRCGRVSNGVCYRLYSEQDFLGRPRFTTPEIHRSNLASVILRMLAFKLGDIRSFPFIDPPSDTAIRGGYRLLEELDAVYSDHRSDNEDDYRLTKLGRRLAQIPVDPTVARMLLQAHRENAIEDVLVIASGLSIQDPRERPAELKKEADEMQKRFVHKESDFLTLLNIWNAYHDEMDRLTQAKLRKFCKQHFVSYQRMREWRDVHHQLERILKNLKLLPSGRDNNRGLDRKIGVSEPKSPTPAPRSHERGHKTKQVTNNTPHSPLLTPHLAAKLPPTPPFTAPSSPAYSATSPSKKRSTTTAARAIVRPSSFQDLGSSITKPPRSNARPATQKPASLSLPKQLPPHGLSAASGWKPAASSPAPLPKCKCNGSRIWPATCSSSSTPNPSGAPSPPQHSVNSARCSSA
jgi:ATP-dependent helicase HrpA